MKISAAFAHVHLVCVETAPFIYYTENRAGYVEKMRQIFQRLLTGQLDIVASTITLTECLAKPLRDNDVPLVTAYTAMLRSTHHIELISVNAAIASRAADLRARYNLRTPDALHVATGLTSGCDAFLTNDLALKRVQEISVIALDDLELD